jgi:molybdopterin molybdotransferase
MLSVDQALQLVLQHTAPRPGVSVGLSDALGQVLAETVTSDIDSPPHDKSVVDGYALRAADVPSPSARLRVLEEVTAGMVPTMAVEPGTATRIMTGAPIPEGADAVVMVEQTELDADGSHVQVQAAAPRSGQNIMRRAASMSRGQTVLSPGTLMRAIELGLLAEVGRTAVRIVAQPTMAVVPTGDELVDHWQVPGPGQIRDSNGTLLINLATQAGAEAHCLRIATDDEACLRERIETGFTCDVLLLSGGVSAGVLDLVPRVLQDLGVEQVFHKVNLKPGKPLWFGLRRGTPTTRQTLVFGLPGNPVSSLVCFELFVRPAIQKLSGLAPTGLPRSTAILTKDHPQRGERQTFWPAAVGDGDVTPLPWKGSGDLATLSGANCLAHFPPVERLFKAGETIEVLHLP